MKKFLIKYVILMLLGIGAFCYKTGEFWTDLILTAIAIVMFYIMYALAKREQAMIEWLENETD